MTITEIIETPNKELEKMKILKEKMYLYVEGVPDFYQIIETVQLLYFVVLVVQVKLNY